MAGWTYPFRLGRRCGSSPVFCADSSASGVAHGDVYCRGTGSSCCRECPCSCPRLDLSRDRRYGRVEEMYSEDPYLVGQLGVAAVRGLLGDGALLDQDHVFATAKHFVHGQPENGTTVGSNDFSERIRRAVLSHDILSARSRRVPGESGFLRRTIRYPTPPRAAATSKPAVTRTAGEDAIRIRPRPLCYQCCQMLSRPINIAVSKLADSKNASVKAKACLALEQPTVGQLYGN